MTQLPLTVQRDLLLLCYKNLSESIGLFKQDKSFTASIAMYLNFMEI